MPYYVDCKVKIGMRVGTNCGYHVSRSGMQREIEPEERHSSAAIARSNLM